MNHPASSSRAVRLRLALGLVLATVFVYWPVIGFGFTGLDDQLYVTENPHVLEGLSLRGVVWAFTTIHAVNWHPLTWLSLMLDSSIGGGAPGVYHATNVILHILGAVLLFLAFDRMTGRVHRSAVVALLFAVHPLHVESVAWVAERKDVLSAVFWFLTLLAYARYAERPAPGRYALVLLSFTLGLLAKPMLVTLPVVLLLLDVWPLGRFRNGVWPLVREKLPLFALSAVSSTITLFAQSRGGAVGSFEVYPLWARAANAAVSYVAYLASAVWPAGLAVIYPHPGATIAAWPVVASAAILLLLTFLAIKALRSRPFLTIGWFWYLVTLVPVIGLVQVGMQARADRYTYIPLVGIFVAVTWMGAETWIKVVRTSPPAGRDPARQAEKRAHLKGGTIHHGPNSSHPRATWTVAVPVIVVFAVVLPLMIAAREQVGFWRDRRTLFTRVTEVAPDRATAHNTLGTILYNENALDEAIREFRRTIELKPRHFGAHNNLALALQRLGKPDEALREFREAIRINPRYAEAYEHLGQLLLSQGQTQEAIAQFMKALEYKSQLPRAEAGLASALLETGDIQGAVVHAGRALEQDPRLLEAHMVLGAASMLRSDFDTAVRHFSEAVSLAPDIADGHANLGGALLQQGHPQEAIEQCREALRLEPNNTGARTNLALSLLKLGRRDDAKRELIEVLRIDPANARARRHLDQMESSR